MKGSPRKGCKEVEGLPAAGGAYASMKGSPRKGCKTAAALLVNPVSRMPQ